MSLSLLSLRTRGGIQKKKEKKVCCKDGKHFDQPVCSRCCETFPPRVPRFPSRLIKEEIALEEAMMTQGLVVVQRPLYRVHILHKKTFPKVSTSKLPVPAVDESLGSLLTSAAGGKSFCSYYGMGRLHKIFSQSREKKKQITGRAKAFCNLAHFSQSFFFFFLLLS